MNQDGAVTIRINPYFHGTDGIVAGVGFDGLPQHGVSIEVDRRHPKDVAGKIAPRLFLDRHDRLVQTDWPLARFNQLRIIVTKEVAAEVKRVGQCGR